VLAMKPISSTDSEDGWHRIHQSARDARFPPAATLTVHDGPLMYGHALTCISLRAASTITVTWNADARVRLSVVRRESPSRLAYFNSRFVKRPRIATRSVGAKPESSQDVRTARAMGGRRAT